MRLTPRTGALAAVVLALGLGACGSDGGGDKSEAEIKSEIAEQFADVGGLDKEAADCFAGVIVDEIGVDKLKDVDFNSADAPEGLEEEFTNAALTAVEDCNLDASSFGN
jgi:hypothetical protein